MSNKAELLKRKDYTGTKILLTLLFVYVVLFEFILPANMVLPKPSLLLESYESLWNDYDLFTAFAQTTSIAYGSIIIGYAVITLFAGLYIKSSRYFSNLTNNVFRVTRYLPAFFFAVLFAYWFGDSTAAEFVFALIAVIGFCKVTLFYASQNAKEEYILAAKGLGAAPGKIETEVIWKSCQPKVYGEVNKLHYYVWILLLVYEFVSHSGGFGLLYSTLLNYNDFAGIFAVAILIGVLIFIGDSLLSFIKNKMVYWEA